MYRGMNVADCAVEELLSYQFDPHTLVLQPIGHLDSTNYREFQILLGMALEQAVSGVIVDCLWVETVDEYGIQTLVSGIERAANLGKTISFAAMNPSIRIAMEAEWDRQRDMRFGSWQDLFGSDLEQFLDEQVST